MARRRSLAERVVWAVTATVALLVGLQSVLAFVAMHAQEDELSETMLQREVQLIVGHILQPGLAPTGTMIDSSRVSAWLTRDGAGADEIPAPMRNLSPGLYHFAPDGKSLHVAVADTEDGRLTVVLDATTAEERVDRGRPDRHRDTDDRALGARSGALRRRPRRRGQGADGNVQPLSRPCRRHGRARA